MDIDYWIDDVVLFEASCRPELLCHHLRAERLVWSHFRDGVELVVAVLGPEPEDLARLLRAAEEWLAEQELGSMDFEIDGRRYTLRAAASARTLARAA
jgi:hypothetical protein